LYSCINGKTNHVRKALKVEFCKVTMGDLGKLLLINNDKPPGIDNVDGKILRMVAGSIATPVCQGLSEPRGKSLSSELEGS
jgi:hypothetical protein